jgi:hypothetical protein
VVQGGSPSFQFFRKLLEGKMSTKQILMVGFAALLVFVVGRKVEASLDVQLIDAYYDAVTYASNAPSSIVVVRETPSYFGAFTLTNQNGSSSATATVNRYGNSESAFIDVQFSVYGGTNGGFAESSAFQLFTLSTPAYFHVSMASTDTAGSGELKLAQRVRDGQNPYDQTFFVDRTELHSYSYEHDGVLAPGEYYVEYLGWVGLDRAETGNVSFSLIAVPEPATLIIWSLLGALGITIGWQRRRRAS